MKALRRKEIIKAWSENKQYLDCFCCPECRDILLTNENHNLECLNDKCLNDTCYDEKTGEPI
jgi:hypothetical protein